MNGQSSKIVGAGAGIVAALLIFLSVAVVDPLREATDDELIRWWSTNSNLDDLIISGYTRLFALPFFLVFAAQLRNTLRHAGGGLWTDVAYSSGIVCAGALGVAALLRIVLAQSVRLGDEPLPGVDTLRLATDIGLQAYGTLAHLFLRCPRRGDGSSGAGRGRSAAMAGLRERTGRRNKPRRRPVPGWRVRQSAPSPLARRDLDLPRAGKDSSTAISGASRRCHHFARQLLRVEPARMTGNSPGRRGREVSRPEI